MYDGNFLVSATVTTLDGVTSHVTAPYEARTAHEAETIVRRDLNRNPFVVQFSITLVREVRYQWNGETGRYDQPVVIITDSWAHSLPAINHR